MSKEKPKPQTISLIQNSTRKYSGLEDLENIELETISPRERRELQGKIRKVFHNEMKILNEDMQSILADDIVTAFLNRISIFIETEAKIGNP